MTLPFLPAFLAGAALLAATLSAVLIRLLHPLLVRYALARPNARSSHSVPTPQGGGIAVLAATILAAALPILALGGLAALPGFAILCAALIGIAIVGGIDDIRPLSPALRLVAQAGAVALVVWTVDPARLLPDAIPLVVERLLVVLAGTWWVNLVNFMDGIDWITVAEMVPLASAIALFGVAGIVPAIDAVLAAALAGALLGFAPANRPVARLFLGDVGSLPLGLLTGTLLLKLAAGGHVAAALLLPLYYCADATLTLVRRALSGERVWEAHRSHFYQRALAHGLTVMEVDARVLALNLALAALAVATIAWPDLRVAAAALAVGAGLVAATLRRFATQV